MSSQGPSLVSKNPTGDKFTHVSLSGAYSTIPTSWHKPKETPDEPSAVAKSRRSKLSIPWGTRSKAHDP